MSRRGARVVGAPAGEGASRAFARIVASGGREMSPPRLLPARAVLDLSGEAVWSRLCIFAGVDGEEWCLRPDMTTAAALMAARGELSPGRYHYVGDVYRLPNSRAPKAPIEFSQTGFEWFGGPADAETDAAAASLGFEAAAGCGPAYTAQIGDVGLYRAMIDALGLSAGWQARMHRAFSRANGPNEQMAVGAENPQGDRVDFGALLRGLSLETAQSAVVEILRLADVPLVGRTAAEIAERLQQQAAEVPPSTAAREAVAAYLGLQAPISDAVLRLKEFVERYDLALGDAICALEKRIELLTQNDPPYWRQAVFTASLGRSFEYYDGFVFALRGPSAAEPVLSGGRYDQLISRLSGGARSMTAIGAALRNDLLSEVVT